MAQEKRYLGESGLQTLVDLIKAGYAKMVHSHTISEITDYTVDSEIKSNSENPVQNQVVKAALDEKVPVERTVNGKTLEANINLSASDVGTMTSEEIISGLDSKANATEVVYIDVEDNENVEYTETPTGSIGLVDNLESTSTTSALTARQGNVLKGYIDNLSVEIDNLSNNSNINKKVVILNKTDWSNNTITVSVDDVTYDNIVIVSPDPDSMSYYNDYGCYCKSQGNNTLTFKASETPSVNLIVNVVII